MSPLRKLADCKKWTILDEIFLFGNSVMPVRQQVGVLVRQQVGVPEHQWIEKKEKIAKRVVLGFREFSEWTQD